MVKIVDNMEYLDYAQAAKEYGLSVKSIPSMITRGTFTSTKFNRDQKGYISRDQLEAYKQRKHKNKLSENTPIIEEKERSTQEVPFPLQTVQTVEMYQAETIRMKQTMALEEMREIRITLATMVNQLQSIALT